MVIIKTDLDNVEIDKSVYSPFHFYHNELSIQCVRVCMYVCGSLFEYELLCIIIHICLFPGSVLFLHLNTRKMVALSDR